MASDLTCNSGRIRLTAFFIRERELAVATNPAYAIESVDSALRLVHEEFRRAQKAGAISSRE